MLSESESAPPAGPEDASDLIRIVEEFEDAWQQRRAPDIDRSLAGAGPARPAVLRRLVHVDLEYRLKAGEPRRVESYLERYPELASDRAAVVELLAAEFDLRRRDESELAAEDYLRRFPQYQPEIQDRLRTTPEPAPRPAALARLGPGQRLGEFELLQVLGAGSFARVFLARQVSLDRQVALKVSANLGNEARTLARLEHAHIVQVFSETVDPGRDLRLLCMQYVPGTTLAHVIRSLAVRAGGPWRGSDLLAVLDALEGEPVPFDPAALRDREYLGSCDLVQAASWLGARLAEALAYAHGHGVLHRDVKPANILVNRYGRPLLADFNLAFHARPRDGRAGDAFGGTLAYMAPEHLDACGAAAGTPPEAVDARSDVYALGVVLFELLTGRLPFGRPPPDAAPAALGALADERRRGAPSPRCGCAAVSGPLDRAVRRCLEPLPGRRYQSAAELARALEGCRRLQRSTNQLPPAGPLTRALLVRPFLFGLVLILLPHLLASVVNITYNQAAIVGGLTPAQQAVFPRLVLVYNAAVYAVCLVLLGRLFMPAIAAWRQLSGPEVPDADHVAAVRRGVLGWPRWIIALSCLGWLPGVLWFPLGLHAWAGPVSTEVFGQFFISNSLAGLIALTYSFFAAQYVVLRVLYPRLWVDARGFRELARHELGALERLWRLFQWFAGLIPLAGAALMVGVGPEQLTLTFRLLILGLLALGVSGFGLALLASSLLDRTLAALRGSDGRPDGGRFTAASLNEPGGLRG